MRCWIDLDTVNLHSDCSFYTTELSNYLSTTIVLQRKKILREALINEVVQMRMNFSSDAIAKIEGLLDVNRDFCRKQMAEKALQMLPPNY